MKKAIGTINIGSDCRRSCITLDMAECAKRKNFGGRLTF
jgi:hypothetical protein